MLELDAWLGKVWDRSHHIGQSLQVVMKEREYRSHVNFSYHPFAWSIVAKGEVWAMS
jgi:hypothetical protein